MTAYTLEESIQHAKEWISHDPNPTTRDYVKQLIESSSTSVADDTATTVEEEKKQQPKDSVVTTDQQLLKDLFGRPGRIDFGTAGLRSSMSPGPHGMNDLVVIQTAQGLAKYCRATEPNKNVIVIGYDHRATTTKYQISSQQFAIYTALVFSNAGFEPLLFHGYVPTPLVAFTTKKLPECGLGIMITASHNPKEDAGYKIKHQKQVCQVGL